MPRANITIHFQGTLNITNNIDPTLSHEQILKQAKELLAKGEFTPDNLNLQITNIQDLDPPTVITKYGKYWKNDKGEYHRDNGPACIHTDGSQYWYQNNLLHRENGPAFTKPNGTQYWYQNGHLHRTDGPAYVGADGTQSYYLKGKPLTKPDWLEQIDPPTHIDNQGNKVWRNEKGKLHRENGPAVIYSHGAQYWYQNGKLHRENGPAYVSSCNPNANSYYLDGIKLSEQEWKEKI